MRGKFALIIVLIVLFCVVFLLNQLEYICPAELSIEAVGSPVVIQQKNRNLFARIRQVVSDGKFVYVAFGQYGAIQVFDLNGHYQYTISVYSSSQKNGWIGLAAQNGMLYVKDKAYNVYIFSGDKLLAFMEASDAEQQLGDIVFDGNSPDYIIRWGSVWHNGESVDQCVVKRPIWMVYYQNYVGIILIWLIVMAFAGIVIAYSRKTN